MSVKKKKSEEKKVTIKIPGTLYNRLSDIVSGSGFNSVTDFIVYVLRDLASAGSEDNNTERMGESLSREEIEAIRKRLKTLGYL